MSTEKRNESYMLKQSRYSKGKKNVKQYSKNNASKKGGSGKNSYNAYYKKNDDGFQPKSNGKLSYGKKKNLSKSKGYPKKKARKPSVKIAFLGGLNEIGKNITLVECENDIIIVDCGMAFPDGDMLGVDLVIPDFTYIEQNADRVKGIILTHGHEDHIGGLPFLLSKVNVPIYGTPLTLGLVGNKLREHSLFNKTQLNVTNAGQTIELGCMKIDFIHVNHSIPDAVAFAIHTPGGTVVHTGDFKIDCTPITGDMIDLSSFARVGDEGVLALLSESTNAERPGYTPTERTVSDSLDSLFKSAENYRIIIATFASNVNRVQQIIDCAEKYGRKVAFSGRSMVNYMDVAQKLGYLHLPENILIDLDMLDKYMPQQVVLVTTGSQGEPMSALSRMAYSDHRKVMVGEGDFIIISANPIPGNEKTVGNVVDELLKKGCKVIYESMYEVHVSGHACQEELKLMHALVKPKYFIPVHGEYRMLWQHAVLAESMGMNSTDIVLPETGQVIEMNQEGLYLAEQIPTGAVLVDGLGIGDVGNVVLRDRKHLSQDGLIIVVMAINRDDQRLVSGPDIISRGFIYVRENEDIIENTRDVVRQILSQSSLAGEDWPALKNRIKDELHRFIFEKIKRNPMILPIILDV